MSAILIDDHTLILTGDDLIEVHAAVALAIKLSSGRNGGAAPRADWLGKLRRGANVARSMSRVGHDSATFPLDESESSQNQEQELSVLQTAVIIGVDPRTVYRLIERDLVLALAISHRDPLRFDRQMVEAYAAAHPRSRGAAA